MRIVIAFVFLLAWPATAAADFDHTVGSPFGFAQQSSVAAGDFNGDGRRDVVSVGGGSLVVRLQQPGGTFSAEPAVNVIGDVLASADFNGDGRADIAVGGNATIVLLRQAGGGWTAESVNAAAAAVAVADFNGDGRPDLATGASGVTVHLRQAAGGFTAEGAIATQASAFAVADFNADGRPDLAVAGDGVRVLLRQAAGGFTAEPPTGVAAGSLAAADLNADTRPDLAVARDTHIAVLLRQAGGGFVADTPIPTAATALAATNAFLAAVNAPTEEITILRRGPQGFTPAPGPHLFAPRAVTASDIDQDGHVDLAVAQGGLAVLVNVPGTRITGGPQDITGDTTPTFTFVSDEPGVTFECWLDADAPAPCTSPYTTPPLKDGEHQFFVRARRPGGAADRTPARADFGVLAGAPPTPTPTVNPGTPTPTATATATPPPGPLPRNLSPPVITAGGVSLLHNCTEGKWENASSFTYAWFRVFSFGPDQLVSSSFGYKTPAAFVGDKFYCVVTARNAFGSTQAVSEWTVLTGLPGQPTIRIGSDYGNVAVRGIDVLQVTQPNSGSQAYGLDGSPFAAFPGGGTPINPPQRRVAYDGVNIDATKIATAVVYVSMMNAPAANTGLGLHVTLRILRDGQLYATRTIPINNPPVATTAHITTAERDNPLSGVQFDLTPFLAGLAGHRVDLDADVTLPIGSLLRGVRQCALPGCENDDRFRLDDIPVHLLPRLTLGAIAMIGQDNKNRPNPETVLKRAFDVWPGGERMEAIEVGRMNVGREQNLSKADHECKKFADVRSCRMFYVAARMWDWHYDDVELFGSASYDVLVGVHDYLVDNGGNTEPGWVSGTFGPGTLSGIGDWRRPQMFINDGSAMRPMTAAAHELGHVLGAPHASSCATSSDQAGESWPPDQSGRLQSLKLDTTAPKVSGRFDPAIDTLATTFHDLMSYCATEADAWVSARNWARAFQTMLDYGARPRALAQAGSSSGRALVIGAGDEIVRFTPGDGADNFPPDAPASQRALQAFDAQGAVIARVGVREIPSSEGASAGWVAVVPARAARLELLRDGAPVGTLTRTRPPTLRMRGRTWTATDPDGDRLTATVEYAPDGRSWSTVSTGPNQGRVKLGHVPGGRRARIRVTVSDGFNATRATSEPFAVAGRPPTPEIVAAPARAVAGERVTLVGSALDDRGRRLTPTWFAGAKRLGRGERITVRLRPGTTRVRLRAGSAEVTRTIRVTAPPLRLTQLTVPARVKPGAKTVRVRYRTTAMASARSVDVRLPGTPRLGLLRFTATLGGVREELMVTRA